MKKALICGFAFLAALAFAPSPALAAEGQSVALDASPVAGSSVEGAPTDGPVVLFLTREEQEKRIARQPLARPGGGGSPLMTFHGGTIMPTSATKAIFWGTKWGTSSFAGDKIGGLDSFYAGFGSSAYAGSSTEYTGTNGQVTVSSSYGGSVVDTSAGPTHPPKTSAVLAEVCKMVADPDVNGLGYYAVYTDLKRGHAGYCAWHSWGSCGGVPVQFAFFFDLDGDPGCDPADSSGLHSQGLAALANVSGHELSEAMTDPRGAGWFDAQGAENADKCAWTFGHPLLTFNNGSEWKIQGNWSNAAYNNNAGYTRGCIDGQ